MKMFIALLFLSGLIQFSNCYPNIDVKIVNGEDATLGQFPHQVLWMYAGNVFCGGSIYNEIVIITAAHCCKPFDDGGLVLQDTSIAAGIIDIDDIDNGQERTINSFLIHPDYTGVDNYQNDICLLTLDGKLKFNDKVSSIALNNEDLAPNTKCIVSGWGNLEVSSLIHCVSNLGSNQTRTI